MPQRPKHIKKSDAFPKLGKRDHLITSDFDVRYNCIAFAADITDKKYWPNWLPDYRWLPGIPRAETLDAFIKFYETFGYSGPSDHTYVEGVEKIANFADGTGKPMHAAKQIGPNKWASKLGDSYDIEHARDAVSGGLYGQIVHYMERPSPVRDMMSNVVHDA
jgi:hypothetical protein